MKVISKVTKKQAMREVSKRATGCSPHSMCPKCLKGKG